MMYVEWSLSRCLKIILNFYLIKQLHGQCSRFIQRRYELCIGQIQVQKQTQAVATIQKPNHTLSGE